MSKPTLTVSVPCPTCGGRRSRTSSEVADLMGLEGNARPKEEYLIRCPDCTDGTIRQAVSCAECKWFNEGWYCAKLEAVGIKPDFGCIAWEAKA